MVYKEECAKLGIKESQHAIPRELLNLKKKESLKKRQKVADPLQRSLDGMFDKAQMTKFSRKDVLHAVAEFVVCDDQVSLEFEGVA